MSTSSALSFDQSTSTPEKTPTSVDRLLAAINADDAEGMAAAFKQVDGEGAAAALAAVGAIVPAGLTKKLLDALVKRGESQKTAEAWKVAAEAAFLFQDEQVASHAATEALKQDPTVGSAAFVLATIANRRGQHDEALEIINNLLAVAPQTRNDPYLIVQLAMAKVGANQPEAALSILDDSIDALTAAGLGFDGELLRARALAAVPERTSDALAAYKRALAIATPAQAPPARDEYTAELIKAKDYKEALSQLALLLEVADQSTALGLREVRAKILAEVGDIDGAVAEVDDSLKITPDPEQRVNLFLFQARLEASRQHWKESADHFNEALQEVSNQTKPGIERSAIQMEKVQRLTEHDISLVIGDLDELDGAWELPAWPLTIDLRVTGLLAANRADEALDWLKERLERAPHLKGHPAAHQVRAEIEFKRGNTAAGFAESKLAADVSEETTDPRAWGAAMMGAFASQQWTRLQSIYERLTTLAPALEPLAHVIAAMAYARTGDAERALALTEHSDAFPSQFLALRDQARAEAQVRLSRFRDAVKTALEGLKRPGIPLEYIASLQLVRAQAHNELQEFVAARAAATAVIDLPESGQTLTGVSDLLRVGALVQRALAFFRQANLAQAQSDTDTNLAQAHSDIDDAIGRLNSTRDLLGELMATSEFAALEPQVWLAKGFLLESEKRNEESLAAYTRACNLEKNGNSAAVKRGYAFSNVGAFGEAVVAFDVALSRSTSDAERAAALVGKGRALVRLRRYDEAIVALHAALDALLMKPDEDAEVFESLGIAYDGLGRKDAALKAFQQAWKLTQDKERKRNLARGISSGHLNLRNPKQALAFLDTAEAELAKLAKAEDELEIDGALLFNRALALDALGQRKEAIKQLIAAKEAGLQAAQTELDRLDVPAGLTRWTYYWFGAQASRRRFVVGVMLVTVAGLALLLAPALRWWLTGGIEWYLLLLPSFAALLLLALPNIKAVGYEDGKLKISAEPLAATARAASAAGTTFLGTDSAASVFVPPVPQGAVSPLTPPFKSL